VNRCGTESGYRDHGTGPKCDPCKKAHAAKRADYRRRRYLNHAPLKVDATGTRRRIQALAAIGWSMAEQSRRLGQTTTFMHAVTERSWVWPETAEKVRALYDELSMVPGDGVRARNEARKRGWPVPLQWDDDRIDDPTYNPAGTSRAPKSVDDVAIERAMAGDRVHLRPVERAEAVRRMTASGLSAAEIAVRLGVSDRTVDRWRAA
jgi:hypothetical protein